MDWLQQVAGVLEVEAPSPQQTNQVLELARDVAHGVERRITPVSTLLVGMSVERRRAAGEPFADALTAVLSEVRAAIPPAHRA